MVVPFHTVVVGGPIVETQFLRRDEPYDYW